MIIDLNQSKPKRIDRQGNPITNPIILEEIERLEEKKASQGLGATEGRRLSRLKSHGDSAQCQNILIKAERKKEYIKPLNLAKPQEVSIEELDKVIEDVFKGVNPFESLRKRNISTRAFYSYLKSPQKNKEYYNYLQEVNKERLSIFDFNCEPSESLSKTYEFARAVFADSCLGELLKLADDAKANRIDPSTYNAVSNNLRWIMAKLFPRQYAEKIAIDSQVTNTQSQEIDIEKIKALSSLL